VKAKKTIFIPSKERSESPETITLFETISSVIGDDYNFVIVVEPQEESKYKKFLTSNTFLEVLPENNKGVAYVFKYLYDKIFLGDTHISFLLDDDINGLYEKLPIEEVGPNELVSEINGGNQKTIPLTRIKEVFDFMSEVPYGINSLSFRQTQWHSKEDYDNFGRICTFICFNRKYMENREELILNDINKYDTSKYRLYLENYLPACFLKNGLLTGITYKYAQYTVPMAKNQGGAFYDYNNTTQPEECSKEIVRLLGSNFAKVVQNKGRTEVKIDWQSLYDYYDGLQSLI
jgi:hypothetical protein